MKNKKNNIEKDIEIQKRSNQKKMNDHLNREISLFFEQHPELKNSQLTRQYDCQIVGLISGDLTDIIAVQILFLHSSMLKLGQWRLSV